MKTTCEKWAIPQSKRAARFVLAGVLAFAACGANAQLADAVREVNGITFVSGGIGSDSRAQLAEREKFYNFKLVTTLEGSGKFVAAARVVVSSAAGSKLVDHVTEGPILLMGLPAGAYTISVTFRGVTRSKKIQARAERLQTEHMRWPADPEQDVVLPAETK